MMTLINSQSDAHAMAAYLDRGAHNLNRAHLLHAGQSRGPRETIVLPPLIKMLYAMAKMIRAGEMAEAASIFRDFSVTPHAKWLGGQRPRQKTKPEPIEPRPSIFLPGLPPRPTRQGAARKNGRKRLRPDSEWIAHDWSLDLPGGLAWRLHQVAMLFRSIRRELEESGGKSKSLAILSKHKLSVRMERIAAILLLNEFHDDIRARLPNRWQPLTPYAKTLGARKRLVARIERSIRRRIKPPDKFYIMIDRGDGSKPRKMGPYSDPRKIDNLATLVRDAQLLYRPAKGESWIEVNLPQYKPRPNRSFQDGTYEKLCEELGEDSAEATLYAWQAWGRRPSAKRLLGLITKYGRSDSRVRAIMSKRGRVAAKMLSLDGNAKRTEQLLYPPGTNFRNST